MTDGRIQWRLRRPLTCLNVADRDDLKAVVAMMASGGMGPRGRLPAAGPDSGTGRSSGVGLVGGEPGVDVVAGEAQ